MNRKWSVAVACAAAFALVLASGAGNAVPAEEIPLPEFMGFYVLDGGKLIELKKAYARVVELDGKKHAGFKKDSQWVNISPEAQFILYNEKVDHLKCNIIGLMWEGKRIVDGQEYRTKKYKLKMWVRDASRKVLFKMGELAEKKNVFRYVPERPLEEGKYVIYFGDSLKKARLDSDADRVFVVEVKGK